jgi:hypothetical protein
MIALTIGIAHTLVANQVYALPSKAVMGTSSGAIEISQDGINFSPVVLTNNSASLSAMFVRSSGTGTILSLKEYNVGTVVSGGSNGGGADLPTAVIGQTLISQGSGIDPIFSNQVSLIGTTPKILMGNGPPNRDYGITINDGAGAIAFTRSDISQDLRIKFDVNKVAFAASIGSVLEISNSSGIILTPAEAGGVRSIQLGRRASDDSTGCGATVECWITSSQTEPALSVRIPGGADFSFAVMPNGSLIISPTASGELCQTKVSLTNGAGSSTATLTNAPAAGNPTKWISINDGGTVRKIPAW